MKKQLKKNVSLLLLSGLLINSLSPLGILARDYCAKPKPENECKRSKKADYIIIGLGGAGAVLAKRLTDDKRTSVIALEAGDNNTDEEPILDPAYAPFLANDFYPQYFWQGDTTPQPQVNNRSFLWTGGRTLGGGTSVNNAVVVKGSPAYWQLIEETVGSAWSVDKVYKRYKELETYIGPKGPGPNTRGKHGPWTNIALPENPTEDSEYLLQAMVEVTGLPAIVDYNNPLTPMGPFLRQDLQERVGDLRESSAYAFLNSNVMTFDGNGVRGRKLKVHFRATALDLLWEKDKVIGVRYTKNGECYEVYAKKEVILSAGFQSAQFLQRNGIGPKEVLDAAGVPVRINNPNIGRLKTHTANQQIVFLTPGAQFVVPSEPFSYAAPGAFLPQNIGDDYRNLQWVGAGIFPEVFVPILLGPLNPKSTGSIKIQNDDPFKIPLVDVGFYSDTDGVDGTSQDLNYTVEGIRNFIIPLNEYFAANPAPNGQTWTLINPSLEVLNDDEAIRDFIKSTIIAAYHWSATVPMGTDASNGAVDSHGRVFGVKGLRVADVSILPYVPDGNTATPAVLVGWTISEFIKAGK